MKKLTAFVMNVSNHLYNDLITLYNIIDPDQFDHAAKAIIVNTPIPYAPNDCTMAEEVSFNQGLIPPPSFNSDA